MICHFSHLLSHWPYVQESSNLISLFVNAPLFLYLSYWTSLAEITETFKWLLGQIHSPELMWTLRTHQMSLDNSFHSLQLLEPILSVPLFFFSRLPLFLFEAVRSDSLQLPVLILVPSTILSTFSPVFTSLCPGLVGDVFLLLSKAKHSLYVLDPITFCLFRVFITSASFFHPLS